MADALDELFIEDSEAIKKLADHRYKNKECNNRAITSSIGHKVEYAICGHKGFEHENDLEKELKK